jgi:hypothetical protein
MPISEILSLSREERLLHEPTVGVITALPHEFAAMQALWTTHKSVSSLVLVQAVDL